MFRHTAALLQIFPDIIPKWYSRVKAPALKISKRLVASHERMRVSREREKSDEKLSKPRRVILMHHMAGILHGHGSVVP